MAVAAATAKTQYNDSVPPRLKGGDERRKRLWFSLSLSLLSLLPPPPLSLRRKTRVLLLAAFAKVGRKFLPLSPLLSNCRYTAAIHLPILSLCERLSIGGVRVRE